MALPAQPCPCPVPHLLPSASQLLAKPQLLISSSRRHRGCTAEDTWSACMCSVHDLCPHEALRGGSGCFLGATCRPSQLLQDLLSFSGEETQVPRTPATCPHRSQEVVRELNGHVAGAGQVVLYRFPAAGTQDSRRRVAYTSWTCSLAASRSMSNTSTPAASCCGLQGAPVSPLSQPLEALEPCGFARSPSPKPGSLSHSGPAPIF